MCNIILQDDTYTIMNPVGTLSNDSSGPAYEIPFSLHNGNGFQQNNCEGAMLNNGQCSVPARSGFVNQDEERYVKGAF